MTFGASFWVPHPSCPGYAHPRRFGLACQLGVLPDVPSIGVANSLLIRECKEPGRPVGSAAALVDAETGEHIAGRSLGEFDSVPAQRLADPTRIGVPSDVADRATSLSIATTFRDPNKKLPKVVER